MPDIATAFKAEITRLARKEVRVDSGALKNTVAAQRSDIADLKRRVQALETLVKRLAKNAGRADRGPRPVDTGGSAEPESTGLRFRAAGMAANRKRLGLSAADFGLLVGATGQSIYAWEAGKATPRPQALTAIAALRGIGKREVDAKLASLKGQ